MMIRYLRSRKIGLYPRDFELFFRKTFNFAQNSDLLYLKPSVLNKFKRKVKLNYLKLLTNLCLRYLSNLNQVKSPVLPH
jgi:hypothetical protein